MPDTHWISVKDKLPEERQSVLVCRPLWYERIGEMKRMGDRWYPSKGPSLYGYPLDTVSHWMPSPFLAEGGNWISVKDRLPESDAKVLFYWRQGEMDIGVRRSAGGWVGKQSEYSDDEVTHWMGLPDPPK
jgi:hypothetical protein